MKIKTANCGEEFANDAKSFVVNMYRNKKMLHIKNCPRCRHSKFLYQYLDFDTIEEAETFPLVFSKCQLCFPNQ